MEGTLIILGFFALIGWIGHLVLKKEELDYKYKEDKKDGN